MNLALLVVRRGLAASIITVVCLIGLAWLLAVWFGLALAGRPVRPWPQD